MTLVDNLLREATFELSDEERAARKSRPELSIRQTQERVRAVALGLLASNRAQTAASEVSDRTGQPPKSTRSAYFSYCFRYFRFVGYIGAVWKTFQVIRWIAIKFENVPPDLWAILG